MNSAVSNMLGLGNSYAGTGSQQISDLLGIQGANLDEREQLLNAVPQYYENAVAPLMPAYDFFQTMLQDHWNSDKQDTVVPASKRGK
jgi:hypothetical protein